MIVVVGVPAWNGAEPARPAGRACQVSLAAAALGAAVELVGRTGDDPAGDALLIALARGGVGHVALLRDPTRATPIAARVGSGDPDREDDTSLLLADEAEGPSATPRATAAGPVLDAADVSLGLRYLADYTVVVVSDEASPAVVRMAAEAATFAGAYLVVLAGTDFDGRPELSGSTTTVLEAPADDPDGAFAALVGAYAAGLDAGIAPDAAFQAALATGWEAPPA